jgi:glucose 1-dehydrogenase
LNHQLNCARSDRNSHQYKILERSSETERTADKYSAWKARELEDVAGIVSFLASEESDYVTGTAVFVDGGLLWNYQEQ